MQYQPHNHMILNGLKHSEYLFNIFHFTHPSRNNEVLKWGVLNKTAELLMHSLTYVVHTLLREGSRQPHHISACTLARVPRLILVCMVECCTFHEAFATRVHTILEDDQSLAPRKLRRP